MNKEEKNKFYRELELNEKEIKGLLTEEEKRELKKIHYFKLLNLCYESEKIKLQIGLDEEKYEICKRLIEKEITSEILEENPNVFYILNFLIKMEKEQYNLDSNPKMVK